MSHQSSTRYYQREISLKQNKNYLNDDSYQDERLRRYPQIESKIDRLLKKIDTLVQQNMCLKAALQMEKHTRTTKQESMKLEFEKYQLQQKQIEECITELEIKAVARNQKEHQLKLIEENTKEQIQVIHQTYQAKIQQILKEFKNKQQFYEAKIKKIDTCLSESYKRLQLFNREVEQLKMYIEEINSINKQLLAENKQAKRIIETRQVNMSSISSSLLHGKEKEATLLKQQRKSSEATLKQSLTNNLRNQVPENHRGNLKVLESQYPGQQEQIKDLLLGISRLEYKLEKSYTYISLLEQENETLRISTQK